MPGGDAPPETTAPMPKPPLEYPDICGRHRLQVEVQMLDREIGFLKEELSSLEELQPASRCCEEVNGLVGTNPDPLIPLRNGKTHKSCCFWRCIRAIPCLNFSWLCCSSKCSFKCRKPGCFGCRCSNCCLGDLCHWSCCRPRCARPCCSCPRYSCGCILSCSNCTEDCICLRCNGPCCICRCLCP